jgi:hypothetical protein
MTKTLFASIALIALVGCSADASEKTDPTSNTDPTLGDPTKAPTHVAEAAASFKDAIVLPAEDRTTMTDRPSDHTKLADLSGTQVKQDLAIPVPAPVEDR